MLALPNTKPGILTLVYVQVIAILVRRDLTHVQMSLYLLMVTFVSSRSLTCLCCDIGTATTKRANPGIILHLQFIYDINLVFLLNSLSCIFFDNLSV